LGTSSAQNGSVSAHPEYHEKESAGTSVPSPPYWAFQKAILPKRDFSTEDSAAGGQRRPTATCGGGQYVPKREYVAGARLQPESASLGKK
jgi:hypothetical protein